MQNQKNRVSIKKWFYNHKGQPTWFSSGIGVGYLYALWLKIRVHIWTTKIGPNSNLYTCTFQFGCQMVPIRRVEN